MNKSKTFNMILNENALKLGSTMLPLVCIMTLKSRIVTCQFFSCLFLFLKCWDYPILFKVVYNDQIARNQHVRLEATQAVESYLIFEVITGTE